MSTAGLALSCHPVLPSPPGLQLPPPFPRFLFLSEVAAFAQGAGAGRWVWAGAGAAGPGLSSPVPGAPRPTSGSAQRAREAALRKSALSRSGQSGTGVGVSCGTERPCVAPLGFGRQELGLEQLRLPWLSCLSIPRRGRLPGPQTGCIWGRRVTVGAPPCPALLPAPHRRCPPCSTFQPPFPRSPCQRCPAGAAEGLGAALAGTPYTPYSPGEWALLSEITENCVLISLGGALSICKPDVSRAPAGRW